VYLNGLSKRRLLVRLLAPQRPRLSVITASTGGSVGQIGPCSQIGAALASLLADLFHFADGDRRKLVICGISAGFSSVLDAPVAGAIFGLEVLFIGGIFYEVLLPSLIAGSRAIMSRPCWASHTSMCHWVGSPRYPKSLSWWSLPQASFLEFALSLP
jgi:H+/Cl- antiporter ClcA